MAFELNKSFIEKLLQTPITDFEISAGCKPGDNIAGSLKAIKVTTKSNEKIHVVYKTFPPKEVPQHKMVKSGPFRVETETYVTLIPAIQKLVKKMGGDYTSPLPKLYAFFNNDEDDYLCMEDVRPQGYKMPIVFTGLNYQETSIALQELAKFHAYSYFLIREKGEELFRDGGQFARFNPTKMRNGPEMAQFFTMISNCLNNAIEILDKTKPHLAKKLKAAVPTETTGHFFQQMSSSTDKENFPTLVHGDFWSNNFLVKYDDKGKAIGIKFVDFQYTRRGTIYEDLVYFIFTSTNTKFRTQHLNQVLFDYYDSFERSLKSVQCPMPIGFTKGSLLDSFEKFKLHGLVHMTFAIPLQMGQPPSPPEGGAAPPPPEVSKETPPPSAGPEEFTTKMFAMALKMMIENSPRALARLEEIAEEILQ